MSTRVSGRSYIRNGISGARPEARLSREDLGLTAHDTVYIFAGVLSELKRVEWLTEQFVRNHNDHEYLLILGEGPCRTQCEAAADDHVRMLGFQSSPLCYMDIADIYISASSSEGFSVAVLEALDCGLRLLLSEIPSHREIFEIDQNISLGLTFAHTEESFRAGMIRIRQADQYASKTRIRQFKQRNLSGEKMTEAYTRIYNS